MATHDSGFWCTQCGARFYGGHQCAGGATAIPCSACTAKDAVLQRIRDACAPQCEDLVEHADYDEFVKDALAAKDGEIGKLNGECRELASSAVEAAKQRDAFDAGRQELVEALGESEDEATALEAQLDEMAKQRDAWRAATGCADGTPEEAGDQIDKEDEERCFLKAQTDAVREYAESLTTPADVGGELHAHHPPVEPPPAAAEAE